MGASLLALAKSIYYAYGADGRTDGRAFGHVIANISQMGRIPHFLSYGATQRELHACLELR